MDLFTYGTLMSPEIMLKVAGCRLPSVRVILSGYQRYLVRDEVYPGIVEALAGEVDGMLYLDVPGEAIERLDVFEGEMYERRVVQVRDEDGAAREAMAYVFRPQYHQHLTSRPWNFSEFILSGRKQFEDGYQGFSELSEHAQDQSRRIS